MPDTEPSPKGVNSKSTLTRAINPSISQIDVERPPMELAIAKGILEKVINFREDGISASTDLANIGGINFKELREAMCVFGNYVVETHKDILVSKSIRSTMVNGSITKEAPEGYLRLLVSTHGVNKYIQLILSKYGDWLIRTEFPLSETKDKPSTWGFFDHRKNPDANYTAGDLSAIERHRLGWRGIRWLAENMLKWDEQRILPEDLNRNRRSLPIPQLKT